MPELLILLNLSVCKRNPKTLFEVINNIVSPATSLVPLFSNDDCNHFLSHFVDKVMAVRAGIAFWTHFIPFP